MKNKILSVFKFKRFYGAFSLVEIMIALVAISVALAAFTPVISKSIVQAKNSPSSYIVSGTKECSNIVRNNPKCILCDKKTKTCLSCNIDESKCGSEIDLKTCTCCPWGTMKIPAGGDTGIEQYPNNNYDFICVNKYNVGDETEYDGIPIPSVSGLQIVNANQSCAAYNNYNKMCCWRGTASNYTAQNNSVAKGSYSVFKRTVCTWAAANAICSALNGSMISFDSLIALAEDYSIPYTEEDADDERHADNGLQFCNCNNASEHPSLLNGNPVTHKFSHCANICVNYGCPGSYISSGTDNTVGCCRPYGIWSTNYNSGNALGVYLGIENDKEAAKGSLTGSQKWNAFSVRCMIKPISP